MRVVFVEPKIEGNIGFLARVMANFDFNELYLVSPIFKISDEDKNRAVHAKDVLEKMKIVDSLEDALKNIDFVIGTTGIKSGSKNITRRTITSKELGKIISNCKGDFAVVIGREDVGLFNTELELCDIIVRIETSYKYPIMNVTHAAAIILYEIYTSKFKGKRESVLFEKNQIEKTFESIINQMNYPENKKKITYKCAKHLIGRSFIFKEEAKNLIGLLKNINHKLRNK